jgi:hypothetical protein
VGSDAFHGGGAEDEEELGVGSIVIYLLYMIVLEHVMGKEKASEVG